MDSPDSQYRHALSLISHELSSPASIVNGYLRLLLQLDVERLTDQQRRMLDQTGAACARLLGLIREVGDLAALEASEPVRSPSSVPVFSLCEEVIPAFRCADPDRSAIVNGDPGSLKRAFGSLIAATAREHGTDQLECYGFVCGGPRTAYAVIVCGRHVLGMVPEDVVANRDTFDRWRGGTGLSVPIACRIIERYGGSIWSHATPDSRPATVWSLPTVSES